MDFIGVLTYSSEGNCWTKNADYVSIVDVSKDFNEKVENIQGFSNLLSSEITKLQKQIENMDKKIFLIHNCANCGATLNIEENKPVFHCKYCGSAYLIGTAQIYSNY